MSNDPLSYRLLRSLILRLPIYKKSYRYDEYPQRLLEALNKQVLGPVIRRVWPTYAIAVEIAEDAVQSEQIPDWSWLPSFAEAIAVLNVPYGRRKSIAVNILDTSSLTGGAPSYEVLLRTKDNVVLLHSQGRESFPHEPVQCLSALVIHGKAAQPGPFNGVASQTTERFREVLSAREFIFAFGHLQS